MRVSSGDPPPEEDHPAIVSAAPEADQTHRIVILRSKPSADLRVVVEEPFEKHDLVVGES